MRADFHRQLLDLKSAWSYFPCCCPKMKVCKCSECTKTSVGMPSAHRRGMRRVFVFAFFSLVSFGTVRAQDGTATQAAWSQLDRGLKSGDLEHRRQALLALAT